jgi:hypothetical protein
MEEWRYSSIFLVVGTRWGWVVSFTPLPLYSRGKSTRYPLDRSLGGPQSRSGRSGEGKKSSIAENRSRTFQPVARHYTDWAIPTHGWYLCCMCSGGQCVWTVNFTWCQGCWPGVKSKFLSCGSPKSTPWVEPQLRDRVPTVEQLMAIWGRSMWKEGATEIVAVLTELYCV